MNPLKKLHKTMTWQEMADRTGISRNQIMAIAEMKANNVLKMRYGNVLVLDYALDVQMLEMITHFPFRKIDPKKEYPLHSTNLSP